MRAAAIAIVCSGCAQLAGIKDTTGPSGQISLSLDRSYVGAAIVTQPLDLAMPPVVILPSSTVTMTAGAPGQWSARASSAQGVLYTGTDLPTAYQHELDLGATQRATEIVYGDPGAQPPPANAMLMLNVTLPGTYAATQTLEVLAVGTWAQHALGPGEVPALGASTSTPTLAYSSFLPMTNQSPLVAITMADQVLVLRYTGQTLTGQLIVPPFDQTGMDPITGTMAAVTPNTPFDATIDPMAVATRLGTVQPAGSAFASSWRLDASPGYALGTTLGVELDGASLVQTQTSIATSYANPFASLKWKPILTYTCSSSRTFMVGSTQVTFASTMTQQVDPASGLKLDLPVALPQSVSLAGTPLATDGMTATVDPTTPLDVSVTTDGMPADVYALGLIDLVSSGSTVMTVPVIQLYSLGTDFTLPPNVLQAGHTYVLRAGALAGGNTNAATGDLETFTFPASYGIATSGVFTVAGP